MGNGANAAGVLPIDIETSPDGQLSDAVALAMPQKKIKLKPGASMKITFSTSLSATTYLVVNLDPGNAVFADDSTPSNNVFVHQIVVG